MGPSGLYSKGSRQKGLGTLREGFESVAHIDKSLSTYNSRSFTHEHESWQTDRGNRGQGRENRPLVPMWVKLRRRASRKTPRAPFTSCSGVISLFIQLCPDVGADLLFSGHRAVIRVLRRSDLYPISGKHSSTVAKTNHQLQTYLMFICVINTTMTK